MYPEFFIPNEYEGHSFYPGDFLGAIVLSRRFSRGIRFIPFGGQSSIEGMDQMNVN
jgi:hypothetical protein